MKPGIEGFILTGGHSKRMGRDKCMIRLGGVRFVDRVAEAIRSAGIGEISTIGTEIAPYRNYVDIASDRGPVAGIQTALSVTQEDVVFAAACDLPFLSSEFILLLIRVLNEEAPDAVIPAQRDGTLQPLAGVYKRSACLPAAEMLLSTNDGSVSVHALLESTGYRIVGFDEYGHLENADLILSNVNTSEELESARSVLSGEK